MFVDDADMVWLSGDVASLEVRVGLRVGSWYGGGWGWAFMGGTLRCGLRRSGGIKVVCDGLKVLA